MPAGTEAKPSDRLLSVVTTPKAAHETPNSRLIKSIRVGKTNAYAWMIPWPA